MKKKLNELQLELGVIATGQFYEFQELRKGTMNRLRNIIFRKATGLNLREIQKKKKKSKEEKEYLEEFTDKKMFEKLKDIKMTKDEKEYLYKMFDLLDDVKEKEKVYSKLVEGFVIKEPIFIEFSQHIKGLGHLMTSMLLYYFGYCEKATYPSSLWKFCGLYPGAKFVKGESGGFNPKARTMCWKIGDSFIKQRSPRYRPIYDKEKTRQIKLMENKTEGCATRLGHADSRARRKTEIE